MPRGWQRDLRRLADTTLRSRRRRRRLLRRASRRGTRRCAACRSRSSTRAISAARTSFNNLKTLHGGLRSLQSLNYPADAAVHPRAPRAGARRAAPGAADAVRRRRPIAIRCASARRCARRAGASTTSWPAIAATGIDDPACTCRPSDVVSRDECLRLNPVIDPRRRHRRRALARLPDAQHRPHDVVVRRCRRPSAGAATANYVEATGVRAGRQSASLASARRGRADRRRRSTFAREPSSTPPDRGRRRWLTGVVTAAHPPAAVSRAR